MDKTISFDKVIEAKDLFCIMGENGVFFICIDPYDTIDKDKEWYKFSLDPYDIDFLKFKSVGAYFIDPDTLIGGKGKKNGIEMMMRYLGLFLNLEHIYHNSQILRDVYFSNDNMKSMSEKMIKKKNCEKIYGKSLSTEKIYKLKRTFTSQIRLWIHRVYKHYNFFDDSLKYIKVYYNDWIRLLNFIHKHSDDFNIFSGLWRFVENYNIKTVEDFIREINAVKHIRGISDADLFDIKIQSRAMELQKLEIEE